MTETGAPATLVAITHNVFARHAGWERRRAVLCEGYAALQPDIVALQETVVADGYDQAADILGSEYRIVHSAVRSEDGVGVSIGSRWPIAHTEELDLKVASNRTGDFGCTTLITTIQAPPPFGPVTVANHFPDYQPDHELERERQTVLAARALQARCPDPSVHVVLLGDLDAEPDAASLRFLAGKQSLQDTSVCYVNAWDKVNPGMPGDTFVAENGIAPRNWPFRRIDHIFLRCGGNGQPTLGIDSCALAFDAPVDGVWPSDHCAVKAVFRPLTAEETR